MTTLEGTDSKTWVRAYWDMTKTRQAWNSVAISYNRLNILDIVKILREQGDYIIGLPSEYSCEAYWPIVVSDWADIEDVWNGLKEEMEDQMEEIECQQQN